MFDLKKKFFEGVPPLPKPISLCRIMRAIKWTQPLGHSKKNGKTDGQTDGQKATISISDQKSLSRPIGLEVGFCE